MYENGSLPFYKANYDISWDLIQQCIRSLISKLKRRRKKHFFFTPLEGINREDTGHSSNTDSVFVYRFSTSIHMWNFGFSLPIFTYNWLLSTKSVLGKVNHTPKQSSIILDSLFLHRAVRNPTVVSSRTAGSGACMILMCQDSLGNVHFTSFWERKWHTFCMKCSIIGVNICSHLSSKMN